MHPVRMEMKYSKTCEFCGEKIEVGSIGFGVKLDRWRFECAECRSKLLESKLDFGGFITRDTRMAIKSYRDLDRSDIEILIILKNDGFPIKTLMKTPSTVVMKRGIVTSVNTFAIAESSEIDEKDDCCEAINFDHLLSAFGKSEKDKNKKPTNPIVSLRESAQWKLC